MGEKKKIFSIPSEKCWCDAGKSDNIW